MKTRVEDRPIGGGIVRHGGLTVAFTGTVKLYDALDRGTWGPRSPAPPRSRARRPRSARRTRSSSPATRSTRSRCRSRGPHRVASSGSTSNEPRWSTPTASRRVAAGGVAARRRTRRSAAPRRAPIRSRPCRTTSGGRSGGGGALTLVGDRGPVGADAVAGGGARAVRRCPGRPSRSPRRDPTAPPRSRSTSRPPGAPATWWARWCSPRRRSTSSTELGSGAKSGACDRDRDRSRRRRLVRPRTLAPRLVARLVERQRRPRMSTAEFSVEVDAPPERVWTIVSDPANIPHWERTS